jgi:hypothetical protein
MLFFAKDFINAYEFIIIGKVSLIAKPTKSNLLNVSVIQTRMKGEEYRSMDPLFEKHMII